MSYQVIARKWRPQKFEDVTGQEVLTRTLQNASSTIVCITRIFFRARAAWARRPPRDWSPKGSIVTSRQTNGDAVRDD